MRRYMQNDEWFLRSMQEGSWSISYRGRTGQPISADSRDARGIRRRQRDFGGAGVGVFRYSRLAFFFLYTWTTARGRGVGARTATSVQEFDVVFWNQALFAIQNANEPAVFLGLSNCKKQRLSLLSDLYVKNWFIGYIHMAINLRAHIDSYIISLTYFES